MTRGQKLGQRSNTYGGSAGEPIGVTSALGNIDEIHRRNGENVNVNICYPLVVTNIAMEAMAHRNRWFTELKNGWIFHGYVK